MQMIARKALALLLSAAICLTLLAGCTGGVQGGTTAAPGGTTAAPSGTTTTTAAKSTTTAQATTPVSEKRITITYSNAGSTGSWVQPDSKAEKWLEDRLNIDLDTVLFDATNAEQQNLIIATGEIPDFGFFYKSVPEMNDQGVIRSIPKSAIYESAPGYAAFLDENPYGWIVNKMPDKDDEYGALTGYNANMTGFAWGNLYRLDWLEKLGIAPKGELVDLGNGAYWTEEAFTTDEFVDIITQFAKNDPDGNGKDDTFGISVGQYENYSWAGLMGAFGLSNLNNVLEDGKAVPYYLSTAYRDYLAFVSDLYNKGLVDPEVATQDLNKAWEKFTAGQIGWQTLSIYYIDPLYTDRPPFSVFGRFPEAKVLITPPMIGADGSQVAPQYVNSAFAYTWYVGRQVDDDKLARILSLYDALSFDEEVFVTTCFGFAGETFDWEDEPYNSAALMKTDLSVEKKAQLLTGLYTSLVVPDMLKFRQPKALKVVQDFTNSPAGLAMTSYPAYVSDVYNEYAADSKALSEKFASAGADRTALKEKFYMDAITGGDVMGGWDKYIADMYAAGGLEEEIELINKYPVVSEVFK